MNDNPEGPGHCDWFAGQFLAFANPGNYYRQDSFTAFPAGDVRAPAAVGRVTCPISVPAIAAGFATQARRGSVPAG